MDGRTSNFCPCDSTNILKNRAERPRTRPDLPGQVSAADSGASQQPTASSAAACEVDSNRCPRVSECRVFESRLIPRLLSEHRRAGGHGAVEKGAVTQSGPWSESCIGETFTRIVRSYKWPYHTG